MSNNTIESVDASVLQRSMEPPGKRAARRLKPTGYPRNWSHLRLIHLRAAAYVCQEHACGVPHFAQGWRHFDGTFTPGAECDNIPGARFITVRLALTHLDDPTPSNCKPTNLRIRCQRCHNLADAKLRREHAWSRRHSALAIGELFARVGSDLS